MRGSSARAYRVGSAPLMTGSPLIRLVDSGFVTSGVLDQQLLFQSGRELLLVWERMRDILPGLREKNSDAFAYSNLETVAQAYVAFLDRRSPGTYAAFSTRQRG